MRQFFSPAVAWCVVVLLGGWSAGARSAWSQAFEQQPGVAPAASKTPPPEDERVLPAPKLPPPKGAEKLPEPDQVWVDPKQRLVYVDGFISLREGYLEMFACKVGTKEHESVVALNAQAATVHAALLAVGAKDGDPVRFQPKFRPPSGTEIEIEVHWLNEEGKWEKAIAQQWVRDAKTKKVMEQPWVFAGSGFWKDEETGREIYMAEAGDVICVSNFTTAMLDIPIESSQSNDGLIFEANTDEIPELGLPVRLLLKPKLDDKDKQPKAAAEAAKPAE
jgi:hypothetical protein